MGRRDLLPRAPARSRAALERLGSSGSVVLALLCALTVSTPALAQQAPTRATEPIAVDEQGPAPGEPEVPMYESPWFWVAIAALAIGITLAIVVDVTTDDPAPRPSGPVLRF